MKRIFLISLCALATACAAPQQTSQNYSSKTTTMLWNNLHFETDPQQIAFIEAELGSRNALQDTPDYAGKRNYIGRTTSGHYGRNIYARSAVTSDRNCSDFRSSAEAQKFFLGQGGPLRDDHGLDRDGDGFACDWGKTLKQNANRYSSQYIPKVTRSAASSPRCYVGPRGGTYTITASGRKNYDGC